MRISSNCTIFSSNLPICHLICLPSSSSFSSFWFHYFSINISVLRLSIPNRASLCLSKVNSSKDEYSHYFFKMSLPLHKFDECILLQRAQSFCFIFWSVTWHIFIFFLLSILQASIFSFSFLLYFHFWCMLRLIHLSQISV